MLQPTILLECDILETLDFIIYQRDIVDHSRKDTYAKPDQWYVKMASI